jgi:hypothetical protein
VAISSTAQRSRCRAVHGQSAIVARTVICVGALRTVDEGHVEPELVVRYCVFYSVHPAYFDGHAAASIAESAERFPMLSSCGGFDGLWVPVDNTVNGPDPDIVVAAVADYGIAGKSSGCLEQ